MHLDKLAMLGLWAGLVLASCSMKPSRKEFNSQNPGSNPPGTEQPGAGDGSGDQDPAVDNNEPGLSQKGELRFKKQSLLKADLSSALGMKPDELCEEFGKSCFDELYNLALGGVEAYQSQVTRGIEKSAVTTPIVLERLILSGCNKRAQRDVGNGDGVIFKVALDARGQLVNPDGEDVKASLDNLYKRAVQRPIEAHEIKALQGLYQSVVAKSPDQAAEKWAALSCYAVLTSLEAVFY